MFSLQGGHNKATPSGGKKKLFHIFITPKLDGMKNKLIVLNTIYK